MDIKIRTMKSEEAAGIASLSRKTFSSLGGLFISKPFRKDMDPVALFGWLALLGTSFVAWHFYKDIPFAQSYLNIGTSILIYYLLPIYPFGGTGGNVCVAGTR